MTRVVIDLAAVASNYRTLAGACAPVPCAAVVKSDAYGLGMVAVANCLARNGCRVFFVADPAEGVALRQCLPNAEIFVLHGDTSNSSENLVAHDLIPVLNAMDQFERWYGNATSRERPAAIHLDTGMNRLGMSAEDADLYGAGVRQGTLPRPALILSHLACADEREHPLNRQQLARLQAFCGDIGATRTSIANSSGIYLGRAFHLDLVRPGAALYGLNPLPGLANPMQAVVRWQAEILQVRDADAAATIGYGATRRLTRRSRIATLAVGYADGYPRAAGNRASVVVGGRKAPVVGRVSMDLVTVDVTDLPVAATQVGTWVDLLDDNYTADHLAADADTIGYEILTQLAGRCRFSYLQDTGHVGH